MAGNCPVLGAILKAFGSSRLPLEQKGELFFWARVGFVKSESRTIRLGKGRVREVRI